MAHLHHTNVIRIGNSKGIRIPKEYLQTLGEKVVIQSTRQGIVIRPEADMIVPPRARWGRLFAKAAAAGEKPEKDVFEGMTNRTDQTEWEW